MPILRRRQTSDPTLLPGLSRRSRRRRGRVATVSALGASALVCGLCALPGSPSQPVRADLASVSVPAGPVSPVVAAVADPRGGGWYVRRDGVVTPIDGAPSFGSVPTRSVDVVAMAADPAGTGYWVVTEQGAVYSFGGAASYGQWVDPRLSPVVGIAASADGHGYWIVRSLGGMKAFGAAVAYGVPRQEAGESPLAGIAAAPGGEGYWVYRSRGRVYAYGTARYFGEALGRSVTRSPIVAFSPMPGGKGYLLVDANGWARAFGDAVLSPAIGRHVSSMVGVAAVGAPGVYEEVSSSGVLSLHVPRPAATTSGGSGGSTSPTSPGTPVPSVPPTSPQPTPQLPGGPYHLIFNDTFDGSSLPSTWDTCYWYYSQSGCSNGDSEGEWYTPNNVTVSDGALHLTALDQTVQGINELTGAPRTYDYTSGMVTSHGTFSFQYGYVEWDAQIPAGQGLWPALWMLPENNSWPPEIDALETIGSQPDVGNFTYHLPSGLPAQGFDQVIPGLSSGWHTFGVNWEPGSITWYVDGQEVASTTDDVTSTPMYLLMDLAVGGSWPGYPNSASEFPASLNIRYVRVWQQ